MTRLLTVRIARDEDVVSARQRARQVAEALKFDGQQQTRVATAVSEIARNVARYAGSGTVEFALDVAAQELVITVADHGRGIPHLESVQDGTYRSDTGMGLGIVGARRMMDAFDIKTSSSGTTVVLTKRLPARSKTPTRGDVARITDRIAATPSASMADEVQQQNHELLAALDELRQRQ